MPRELSTSDAALDGCPMSRGLPSCAFYDSSTYNCDFHSYAQCYATIYGNGGWCRPNIFEPSGRDRRSGRRVPGARY